MRSIPTILLAFLTSCLFDVPGVCYGADGEPSQNRKPPNVVIILTDDQGWGDLSVNGNRNLATPNIDSLARDGATLENFYVCAVCAPTRAEFLTGRYHPRTGVSGVSTGEGRLNADEVTIADVFHGRGYATGAFGKWHNGTQSPYHPNDRGFDEFYGFTSGHWGHYFSPPLDHNGETVRGNGYVVDDFTDKALEFISENRDRPFFCYLPYNTPHSPMMVDDRWYEKFDGLNPEMRHRDPVNEDLMMTRAALAMCENIDWNVGRILTQLDELKLGDNTIVIYFSDNGPNSWRWNGGMKGRKGSVDEGGIRSPFFIRWPNEIKAGTKFEQVTGAIDLLPTLVELAGIEMRFEKPLDGRSIADLLTGQSNDLEDRMLFSVWRKKASVRNQRFRLDQAGKLFDVKNDRGQRNDVAEENPVIAEDLRKALKAHVAEMARLAGEFGDRPFTVGYSTRTVLPARDGVPHGGIQRSSKAPNNSFFKDWTSKDDFMTWDVQVGKAGEYAAIVNYTCAKGNAGATIRLEMEGAGASTEAEVTKVFDPPLYDKAKERVEESHYFVKDFNPLKLGILNLDEGRGKLRLSATGLVGEGVIDVHSIELIQIDGS